MRDTIFIRCKKCGDVQNYTVKFIEGVVKGVKMNKARDVAQQMADKSGPFYDKWLAAMDLRGPQKRCKECARFEDEGYYRPEDDVTCEVRGLSGGQFACKWFKQKEYE